MNIIINLWNNWTTYEKMNTLILVLIILLAVPGLVWLFTKHSKLALTSLISLTITGLLTVLGLVILNQAFNISIAYTYKLIPFIAFFINILCIGTTTGYFMQNHKQKDFDIVKTKQESFKDAYRLTISCILLFSGFAILTPTILIPVIFSLGISLIAIWIHYFLLKKLLK